MHRGKASYEDSFIFLTKSMSPLSLCCQQATMATPHLALVGHAHGLVDHSGSVSSLLFPALFLVFYRKQIKIARALRKSPSCGKTMCEQQQALLYKHVSTVIPSTTTLCARVQAPETLQGIEEEGLGWEVPRF